jgi:hypothetical protein
MLALLGLIPGMMSLIQGVTGAIFDAKVKITQAKTGADRDTAVALVHAAEVEAHERTAALSVIAGSKPLMWLIIVFAAPFAVWSAKIVLWDTTICEGILNWGTACSTPPLRGQVAEWGDKIIGFCIGSATTLSLGRMYFGRKQ